LLAVAAVSVALIGFGCHRNRQRARKPLPAKPPPVPEPVPQAVETSTADEIFYCKAAGASGSGRYSPEGFLVIKGSIGRGKTAPINGTDTLRGTLLETGVLREVGGTVIFEQDHLFPTPGMAATALLGKTANGWIEWKTADGKTLDAVQRLERKPLQ
jgi:hypothetical protein